MGLEGIKRFFRPVQSQEGTAMESHNQKRQSLQALDPSPATRRVTNSVRDEGTSASEPLFSSDPLHAQMTHPESDSSRTDQRPWNKPYRNNKYKPATHSKQTTFDNTRGNPPFKSFEAWPKSDEASLDLALVKPASEFHFDDLAEAHRTIQSLLDQLHHQRVVNNEIRNEAREAIASRRDMISHQGQLLREKDSEVRSAKDAIQRYRSRITQLRTSLHDQNSELKVAQRRLQENLQINHDLERNLDDCKERIFRSQPFQGPTDTQLANIYKNLCDSIDQWVYRSVADGDKTMQQLHDVQLHPSLSTAFMTYFSREEILALSRTPQVGNIMIGSYIMRIVCKDFLGGEFLRLGLDTSTDHVLEGALAALREVEPAKDFEEWQSWRVDLHRALNIFCAKEKSTVRLLKSRQNMILESLKMIGASNEAFDDIRRGCEEFLLEASKLAEGISLSTKHYTFTEAFVDDAPAEGRVMLEKDLKDYNVIDSRTGAGLRSKSKPIADSNGKVGEVIFNVFPSFNCRENITRDETVLSKATIVVQFDKPIPTLGKRKGTK